MDNSDLVRNWTYINPGEYPYYQCNKDGVCGGDCARCRGGGRACGRYRGGCRPCGCPTPA